MLREFHAGENRVEVDDLLRECLSQVVSRTTTLVTKTATAVTLPFHPQIILFILKL